MIRLAKRLSDIGMCDKKPSWIASRRIRTLGSIILAQCTVVRRRSLVAVFTCILLAQSMNAFFSTDIPSTRGFHHPVSLVASSGAFMGYSVLLAMARESNAPEQRLMHWHFPCVSSQGAFREDCRAVSGSPSGTSGGSSGSPCLEPASPGCVCGEPCVRDLMSLMGLFCLEPSQRHTSSDTRNQSR
jgi:hypothetical protein